MIPENRMNITSSSATFVEPEELSERDDEQIDKIKTDNKSVY